MTDNEKRAHDLAVAMIHIRYDRDYKGTTQTGGSVYEIYKDAYQGFLKDFKYDPEFPD